MRNTSSSSTMLFLLGLFSETQIRIVGSIGIAELFIFIAAPVLFVFDYRDLKRNGFLPLIGLALMSCAGCIISSIHNGTPTQLFLRGFAMTYSLFGIPIVIHHYLWRNLNGFKWFMIGSAISAIITIFVFTSAAEVSVTRGGDVASTELYYLTHFGPLTALPMNAFYFDIPPLISIISLAIPTIFTLFTTSTGRSALMILFMTIIMTLSVGRSVHRIHVFKKNIIKFLFLAAIVAIGTASVYKYLAANDYLTVQAREKYEAQTKNKKGVLGLLMGGRSEFFIGLIAAIDKPIYGHGPWPVDHKGYAEEFLRDYGDMEDYRKLEDWNRYLVNTYGRKSLRVIPCHSMIVGGWLFHGILGFPFWIYILCKMFILLKRYIDVVPQWFGYYAVTIPALTWGIFFSGYGARMSTCFFITVMLLSFAAGKGKILLPKETLLLIEKQSS